MAKKRNPSRKQAAKPLVRRLKADARTTPISLQTDFDVVLSLIAAARARAFVAVNTALIDLYWQIGEHIGQRIAADRWGERTVEALAEYIQTRQPNARGFSARNLWRMMQFYETYRAAPKLSPLVRELSWTHNLLILSRCKREQEREFYLRVCRRERWGKRELERQLAEAVFERTVLSPAKLSPPVTELHPAAAEVFRDTYLLDFLDLPQSHSEADLQRVLVEQLKQFLIELGQTPKTTRQETTEEQTHPVGHSPTSPPPNRRLIMPGKGVT